MVGLILGGIVVASLYIAWVIVVFICYCLGQDEVGFLSGEPFRVLITAEHEASKRSKPPQTPRTDTSSQTFTEDGSLSVVDWLKPNFRSWPIRIRLGYVLAGIMFVVFTILLFSKGVANLQDTLVDIQRTSNTANDRMIEVVGLFDNGFDDVETEARRTQESLHMETGTERIFCPNDPNFSNYPAGGQIYDQIRGAVN